MKMIVFDLDGVIIDSRELHFEALNKALGEVDNSFVISLKEHLSIFDGLPTNKKLEMLTELKHLPIELHKSIWTRKQEITLEMLKNDVSIDNKLIEIFKYIKENNLILCVASNSILNTIVTILESKQIKSYVDYIVSNEDVKYAKPNPQMYLKCMEHFGVSPRDTIIVEDSYVGRQAAFQSGATVFSVKNSKEVTLEKVKSYVNNTQDVKMKWENKNLNVLIPMAGEGSRFSKAGYTFPKPLIEVNGKPMIQIVVDNLGLDANYIFLIRREHQEKYNVISLLNRIAPNCKVVIVDSLTEGAACTTLLAEKYINNDMELLIANSDQYVEWNSGEFYHSINNDNIDGSILTFKNNHPKWSYCALDEYGNVTKVVEKEVISDIATIGIYYWKRGKDYVKYANQMISKDIRYGINFNGKGEFYVAPVYNEAIIDGKIFKTFNCEKMYGLGVPEDLNYFLKVKNEVR